MSSKNQFREPMSEEPRTALVRKCDTCGNVNAVDLDGTPEHWKELQLAGHTVLRVTEREACEMFKTAAKCDHKALIAELRKGLA